MQSAYFFVILGTLKLIGLRTRLDLQELDVNRPGIDLVLGQNMNPMVLSTFVSDCRQIFHETYLTTIKSLQLR